MQDAVFRENKAECPEELHYGFDLALVSETHGVLKRRLEAWKGALSQKG